MSSRRNLILLLTAAFLRSSGVGMTGVVLALYLSRAGFSAVQIGMAIAVGLAGGALATLGTSLYADRLGRRRTLTVLSLLAAAGGVGLAVMTHPLGIFLVAFAGLVNGMGRDRGAAFTLEQAILPELSAQARRTWVLAWYNVVLDAGHAAGALAGALPFLVRRWLGLELVPSYQFAFWILAGLNLLGTVCYVFLSSSVEGAAARNGLGKSAPRLSPQSKRVVGKLMPLFALDSLGGGFLTSALIAYWFFRRFGITEEALGPLFLAVRVANAASYLSAAWLARRIGLLNTMVFTHIPSNIFLLLVPLAPSLGWAVGFFLAREFLVEMDVPTRQSYVLAVVQPSERTAASGFTNLARNASWAVAPTFAGLLMQQAALAAPLFLGGGIKLVYDGLLYVSFRRLKPPEERGAAEANSS